MPFSNTWLTTFFCNSSPLTPLLTSCRTYSAPAFEVPIIKRCLPIIFFPNASVISPSSKSARKMLYISLDAFSISSKSSKLAGRFFIAVVRIPG